MSYLDKSEAPGASKLILAFPSESDNKISMKTIKQLSSALFCCFCAYTLAPCLLQCFLLVGKEDELPSLLGFVNFSGASR